MLHWKEIIDNPNIYFYYDYVEDSVITYENVISNSDLLMEVKRQVEKTIKFIKEGVYVDTDIE